MIKLRLSHKSATGKTRKDSQHIKMESSAYQNAICWNNEGVTHFESGNYEEARVMFREALEAIKVSMAESNQESSNTCGSDVRFQWSANGPIHAELNLPVPAASNFIFRRALVIFTRSDTQSTADLPEESTAIIYNMALSYLLSGFLTNCSNLLDKARNFLDIVVAIRQRRSESAKLDGGCLLDTAICNNLGWLHEEFCDYGVAQQCYEEVSVRLGALKHSGFVEKQDSDGFIMNLVVNAHPNMAAAA